MHGNVTAMAEFFFCACQPGAERMLKSEVARVRPELHPAFGRPGLVTWKSPTPVALDEAPALVFARVSGRSLGRATQAAEVIALARTVAATRLHVWHRLGEPAPELAAELLAAGDFQRGDRPDSGEVVLDVIAGSDEPWFVGAHRHGPTRSPIPGGLIQVAVPEDAPSRAFAKIEEALLWSGARPRPGQVAVEIGSAPGGASLALLRRGLAVVGIDPGAMMAPVAGDAAFTHLAMAVGAVRLEELPARADWLLLDVNLAPQVALHAVKRLVPRWRDSLTAAFLTLKLNEERFADEIPTFLERVRAMGFESLRATQLPSNRQEFLIYATRLRRR